MTQIFRDTSLSIIHVFVKKEIDVLLTVSLNYISCLDCSSKSLFNRFAGCCCFQSYMNRMQDCSSIKIPCISNSLKDYGVQEVNCKRKWFRDLFPPGVFDLLNNTSFILKRNCSFKHSTARFASLAFAKIQKWLTGRVILEIEENKIFSKFFALSPLLPCLLHNGRLTTEQFLLIVNSLNEN